MNTDKFSFIQDGGEMGELIRRYDWSNNPLKGPEDWPQSLRTSLSIVLHSKFPMFLFWGEALICFYNDAYRQSLGNNGKHPAALGKRGQEVWREIWDAIRPVIDEVMINGNASYFTDQLLPIYRNGKMEDVYWTYSYSPIFNESGVPGGVFVACMETTSQVINLKQIEENKDQLHFAIEAAQMGTWDLNPLTNELSANNRLKEWFGFNATDTLLLDVAIACIAEEDRERIAKAITNALRPEVGEFKEEFTLNDAKNKIERKIRSIGKAWFNDEKIAYRFTGAMQDITEQKKAETVLKNSEATLRSVIAASPASIALFVGKNMDIEMANEAFIDVIGKGPDILHKPLRKVMPELETQPFLKILDDVYTTGKKFQSFASEAGVERNGVITYRYYNITYTPLFNLEGSVYAILDLSIDVTDVVTAKQQAEFSERNLRRMILQAPVAIGLFKGPEYVIDIVNPQMETMLGRSAAQVEGKPFFVAMPEIRAQGLEEVLERVMRDGTLHRSEEQKFNLPRTEGMGTFYISYTYQPLRDADGNVSGIMVVAIDVTQQVLARLKIEEVVKSRTKALAESNKNLIKSNDELAQFAYIASHDLQEPLRKVITFSEMLERQLGAINEPATTYLSKIKKSTARMVTLIKDVLAYSQINNERDLLGSVNLNDVMANVTNDFELLIEQTGATIHYRGLPVIEAIPLQMGQLFTNFLSNSLKFKKEEVAPIIDVSATILSTESAAKYPQLILGRAYHEIAFKDNGIGFGQEYAEQIFNIFTRLHGNQQYPGTGIGLALCKKIIQNHQGYLFAESSPADGTIFKVILPEKQS